MNAQSARLVRSGWLAPAGNCLALLASLALSAPAICEPNIGVVQQPLTGASVVAPVVLDALGLVKVNIPGAVCSGAMLTPTWVLTAAHCIPGVPANQIVVTGTWPGAPSIAATAAVDFTADGFDVAVIHLLRTMPRNSTDALPAITTYGNDRLRDATVETFGAGISRLAVNAGGGDSPSFNDGLFRSEIFKVSDATDKTVKLQNNAGSIAGGDSGGPSYLSLWIDPDRHDRGIYRAISGVASRCQIKRLAGHEDTPGWTWVRQIDNCDIATPGPIRDKIAAVVADTTGERNDSPSLFGDTTPAGVNRNRALYALAVDRPLVPPVPIVLQAPLAFSACVTDGMVPIRGQRPVQQPCPLVGSYNVWLYQEGRQTLLHTPSGLCLAPQRGGLTAGTLLVLATCTGDMRQAWVVKPSPAGTSTWQLMNLRTHLCAAVETPGVGSAGLRNFPILIARPCNQSPRQLFADADAGWAARNSPH